jgi:hypothetical protein
MDQSDIKCSFCGTEHKDATAFMQGKGGVCICDECVIWAVKLMIGRAPK